MLQAFFSIHIMDNLNSQEEKVGMPRIPFIGEKAPTFSAKSTLGRINFPEDYQGKYVILFAHPADFTPICSTEFMTFAQNYPKIHALNTELVGLSADSLYSHIAWLRTIKEKLQYRNISNIDIPFPVIADMDKEIIHKYGMIHADNEFATRSLFIIGPEGKIRAFMVYPMYNGRNVQEVIRLLQAIQRNDKYKVATPAEWNPGERVIARIPRTITEANEKMSNIPSDQECYDWFSCFRDDPKKLE